MSRLIYMSFCWFCCAAVNVLCLEWFYILEWQCRAQFDALHGLEVICSVEIFFYCHSVPSADSCRAVVSYWQKYVHLITG